MISLCSRSYKIFNNFSLSITALKGWIFTNVCTSKISPITEATFSNSYSKQLNLSIIGPFTWIRHMGASMSIHSSLSRIFYSYNVMRALPCEIFRSFMLSVYWMKFTAMWELPPKSIFSRYLISGTHSSWIIVECLSWIVQPYFQKIKNSWISPF